MLGAGQAPRLLHAPDKSRAQPAHQRRVRAQAAPGHDAALHRVHVHDRSQVPVETGGQGLAPQLGPVGHEGLIIGPAQLGQVRAIGERRVQTGHAAALLVHHDPQGRTLGVGRRPAQVVVELPNLGRRLHVAGEKDHPAQALFGRQGQLIRARLKPRQPHHHGLGQAVAHRASVHGLTPSPSGGFFASLVSWPSLAGAAFRGPQLLSCLRIGSPEALRTSPLNSTLNTKLCRTLAVASRARGMRQVTFPWSAMTWG